MVVGAERGPTPTPHHPLDPSPSPSFCPRTFGCPSKALGATTVPGPGDLALTIALSPGQVVTYQFGSIEPFGASFKVTPETTETEVNVRKCFRINGTDRDLVAPQSVFPSLENFKVSSRHGPLARGMGQGQGTPHGYSLSDGTSL